MPVILADATEQQLDDETHMELLDDASGTDMFEGRIATRPSIWRRSTAAIVFASLLLVGTMLAVSFSNRERDDVGPRPELNFQKFYAVLKVDPDRVDAESSNRSEAERELGTTVVHTHHGPRPFNPINGLLVAARAKARNSEEVDQEILELRTAACVVDATHGAYFLERAALAITAATASCKKEKSAHVHAACAADISGVIAAVSFVAEYISEAVLMCTRTVTNMKARCSAGISGIVANTARIATQASFIAGTCKHGAAKDTPIGDSVWQMTRRLRGDTEDKNYTRRLYGNFNDYDKNAIRPTYDERGMEIATCVLDVNQAMTYLADFGIFIDAATKACGPQKYPTGILHPDNREAKNVYCAMNILDVLEAIFMASSFISSAVSHCSPTTNQEALCASGAVGLVGAVNGLSKSALNVYGSCANDLLAKVLDPKRKAAVKFTVWNGVAGRRRKARFGGNLK